MSDQLDMFGAFARKSDPPTSHEAVALVDVNRLEGIVLHKLREARHHGLTTHEIADATGLSLVTVSPRMKPLEAKGLVRRWGERVPKGYHAKQIVWVAA